MNISRSLEWFQSIASVIDDDVKESILVGVVVLEGRHAHEVLGNHEGVQVLLCLLYCSLKTSSVIEMFCCVACRTT
jgi:hypothetical protein